MFELFLSNKLKSPESNIRQETRRNRENCGGSRLYSINTTELFKISTRNFFKRQLICCRL